jgi:hypothetical protein
MKDMFKKKSDIYYSKWATVVQKFQLSMTKLGNHDEIRWFDGTVSIQWYHARSEVKSTVC